MRGVRPFTIPEIKRLSEMWKADATFDQMAQATSRSKGSIQGIASRHRKLFPSRRAARFAPPPPPPVKRSGAYQWASEAGHVVSLPVVHGYTPEAA